MGLEPRQIAFVDEYLVDLNATQAAIRAGYSPNSARQIASQNLSKLDIKAEIEKRRSARGEKLRLTQDMVLRELAVCAFSRISTFVEWGPNGVTLIVDSEIDDEAKAAVAEVSETPGKHGSKFHIKLHDKLSALEKIARMQGWMKERSTLDEFLDALAAIDPDLAGRVRRRLAEHLRIQRRGTRKGDGDPAGGDGSSKAPG